MNDLDDKIPTEEGNDDIYVDLATEYGWKPDGKKSAQEYVKYALDELPKRGEALASKNKKIEAKDSELEHLKVIVDQLANDMKNQKDVLYRQALEDIKAQRRQAIEVGDVERVEELDKVQQNLQDPKAANGFPAVEDFKRRNAAWINGSTVEELEMQVYTTQMDNILAVKNLGPDAHMKALEDAVRAKFKSYFTPMDTGAQGVEGVQQEDNVMSRKRTKNFTFDDLNDAQKMAAKYLSDRKTMTIQEYIKRLADAGDLK